VVSNPQVKILKIRYKGDVSDKYYFDQADEGRAKAKKTNKVEVLVEDGQKATKGTELFKVGDKTVKAERGGTIKIDKKHIKVNTEAEKVKEFVVPKGVAILVKDGDTVKKGDQLTDGSLDLQQLYKLRGKLDTQKYIIKEIQNVYSSQGQPLNDKHVEIIARQMFSRQFIQDSGETDLLPGEIVDSTSVIRENKKAKESGKKEAKTERLLLGITKASLTTDSFLSAASFQETARVLIEAALNGKVDHLEGLKENVIIGRLIPAGTGYRDLHKEPEEEKEEVAVEVKVA
jgi:DNA-directed RNA polymerase subunit beta'